MRKIRHPSEGDFTNNRERNKLGFMYDAMIWWCSRITIYDAYLASGNEEGQSHRLERLHHAGLPHVIQNQEGPAEAGFAQT